MIQKLQYKKNNVSGHPNISIVPLKKGGFRYHVRLFNHGKEVLNKCFRQLDLAIQARDATLSDISIKKPEIVSVHIETNRKIKYNIRYHRNGFLSILLNVKMKSPKVSLQVGDTDKKYQYLFSRIINNTTEIWYSPEGWEQYNLTEELTNHYVKN